VKKAVIIAMLSIYALLSLGVQLHLHYCCGELSDLHFFASKECHHEPEGKEDHCCKKGNCCSFIHIDLKVDDSHQPSETARFIPTTFSEPIVCSNPIASVSTAQAITFSKNDYPPPNSKRYLLFHSLVLYA
jgi:hypothetical protein